MLQGFRWVGLFCIGLCQGCSFLFVDGPPDRHEKLAYFDCTSTAGPEVVDSLYAATFGITAASAASTNTDSGGVLAATAVAGTFAASAIYGIVKTTECNKAKDELRVRLTRVFEREAQFRALEAQRAKAPTPAPSLTPPRRLQTRQRPKPEPPQEPAPGDELPPPPPAPPATDSPAPTPPAPPPSGTSGGLPPPPLPPPPAPPAPPAKAPPAAPPGTSPKAPPAPDR